VRVDWSFPRRYEVELDADFPPAGGQLFFPSAGIATYRVGLRVLPGGGEAWVGAFAGEGFGFDAVAATPDPGTLCVVAQGTGYLVPAADPARWVRVESFPIRDLVPVVERGLLLFADHSSLTAYGSGGVVWTRRLGSDDLEVSQVTAVTIAGTIFDLGEQVEFRIDVESGRDRR
jgi:hypothetical protein